MAQNLDSWKKYLKQVSGLSSLKVNFQPQRFESQTDHLGWAIDRHRAHIGNEAPGPPVPGGVFEKAKVAVRDYRFPNPHLIKGYYDPNAPLVGRNILLRATFLGFVFYFGTRINQLFDDQEKNELGNLSQVWGYSYQTLQGHFEMGEMRFTVWKDLSDGSVSFHIDAYSRPDRIPNFFYRLGFKLFGRSLQRSFARSSIQNLRKLAL